MSWNQNSIAGAASIIEVLQEDAGSISAFKSEGARELCSQALTHLYQTMEWCTERSLMLDLAEKKYVSTYSKCVIRDLFSAVTIQGNNRFKFYHGKSELTDVLCEGSFDVQMAKLALMNAVSNAISHGDGGTISLRVSYTDQFVILSVENKVPTGTTVTDESLKMAIKASINGTNPQDEAQNLQGSANLRSTRSGLRHIALVCSGISASFDLFTIDESPRKSVVMELSFPCCKDGNERIFSEKKVPEEKSSNNEEDLNFPDSLIVAAIDDSKLICKGYERVLFKKLQADTRSSKVCCPLSLTALQTYVDIVCGATGHASDILIIDQNIDLAETSSTAYGTEIVKDIRCRSFAGLIVLRTANNSVDEVGNYLNEGCVDICVGKSDSQDVVAKQIKQAYVRKIRGKILLSAGKSALKSTEQAFEESSQNK